MSQPQVPRFAVVPGRQIQQVLTGAERRVVSLVESAYRRHGAGGTINPPSYFLRFPDRPDKRIIALPASTGDVDGLKWISSVPGNVAAGLPRASAVLILNDPATGYPYACLESSLISAARTAGSAALAAHALTRERPLPRRLGVIGAGPIGTAVRDYLAALGWTFDAVGVHDRDRARAERFGGTVYDHAADLVQHSDLIVFATVAARPHVTDPGLFAHHPVVLHVSLRDLAPEILVDAVNVVDDVEHCLKASTSPHLAEQLTGGRDFLDGTIDDVLTGRIRVPADRTVVFSPFGLGVLDLAVGRHVYTTLEARGVLQYVDGFFGAVPACA